VLRAGEQVARGGPLGELQHARQQLARAWRDDVREKIVAALKAFHRAQPQATGMETAVLRKQLAPQLPAEAFQSLLRELADERKLEIASNAVRIPGHDATSNPEDERMWLAVVPALKAGGFSPPTVAELAAALKLKEAALKDFLHRKSRGGSVMRVTDRFYLRETLATLAATAHAVAKASPNGMFTAAQYRDATGTGRGLAIEILEFLDTLAITQRVGDARKLRKDFVPILGAAEAAPKPAPRTAPAAQGNKPRPPASNYRR